MQRGENFELTARAIQSPTQRKKKPLGTTRYFWNNYLFGPTITNISRGFCYGNVFGGSTGPKISESFNFRPTNDGVRREN